MSTPSPYMDEIAQGTHLQLIFLPKRLQVQGRPELSNYPKHVIFGATPVPYKAPASIGFSVYIPDFDTFKEEDGISMMIYRNIHEPANNVEIAYDKNRQKYIGGKTVNGKDAGEAIGFGWDGFFTHLTSIGMTPGDRYAMREYEGYEVTLAQMNELVGMYEKISEEIEKEHAVVETGGNE